MCKKRHYFIFSSYYRCLDCINTGMYKQQGQAHTAIQFDLDRPMQSIALLSFTRRINCFWQICSSY